MRSKKAEDLGSGIYEIVGKVGKGCLAHDHKESHSMTDYGGELVRLVANTGVSC
jgi:hypothetical protein